MIRTVGKVAVRSRVKRRRAFVGIAWSRALPIYEPGSAFLEIEIMPLPLWLITVEVRVEATARERRVQRELREGEGERK